MNINDLPEDVLAEIFLQLPWWSWFDVENVCTRWSAMAIDIWRHVIGITYESYEALTVHLSDGRSSALYLQKKNLFAAVLKRCASSLQTLTLDIPAEPFGLDDRTIILAAALCKKIRRVSIRGNVSQMAEAFSVACHDMPALEEVAICDESAEAPDTSEAVTTASLISDIVSTCPNLRILDVHCIFSTPPSLDACRRLGALQCLQSVRWFFWQTLSPEHVCTFLAAMACCRETLVDLKTFGQVTKPLDSSACSRHLQTLAGSDGGHVRTVDIGFQLMEAVQQDDDGYVYYDERYEAPWTLDFLTALDSFANLRDLTLRHFDLDDHDVLKLLARIVSRLTILQLVDNNGVTGKTAYYLRGSTGNLKTFVLTSAAVSYMDLAELIAHSPKLESVRLSNVDTSFKKLVLAAHAALHRCRNDGQCDAKGGQLRLTLGTAVGYVHDEARTLKDLQICGLRLMSTGHGDAVIRRT